MVWGDVKLEEVEVNGKKTELLRLKIRNPKESRSQHTIQFVEMLAQEGGGWMRPVQTYKLLLFSLRRKLMFSAKWKMVVC